MRILSLLLVGLLMPTASIASSNARVVSVEQVKSNPVACTPGPIRVKAYLVSTEHGAYVVDAPNGSNALGVVFLEAGEHADTSRALVERLRFARVGKPYAQIHGVFEGRVIIDDTGKPPKFEIYAEIYGALDSSEK